MHKNYEQQHQPTSERASERNKNKGRNSKTSNTFYYWNDRVFSCLFELNFVFIQLIYGVIALVLRELKTAAAAWAAAAAAAATINKLFHFFVFYISFWLLVCSLDRSLWMFSDCFMWNTLRLCRFVFSSSFSSSALDASLWKWLNEKLCESKWWWWWCLIYSMQMILFSVNQSML